MKLIKKYVFMKIMVLKFIARTLYSLNLGFEVYWVCMFCEMHEYGFGICCVLGLH